MSARANWFVEDVAALDDEPDPFAVPIEEVGERIDLRNPGALLEIRLVELVRREGNLFGVGITCPIKDRADASCHACPVSRAHDQGDPLSALCRIGREQEVVLTELAVLACRDQ